MHDLPLLDVPFEPCLTLPPGFRIVERDVHLHRIREPDWHRLGNVAVSRPARACLELSKEQGVTAAVIAADAAAHRGLVTPDSLRETYRSMRGRGGAPLAQQVMDLMDGRSESALELWRAFSRARHLREAGVPLLLTPRYAHTRAA
jgi:hypothetical protein